MDQKIAILRGINVGGNRIMRMADLKARCEYLGWQQVQTYIQSGNVIFHAPEPDHELESILESEIAKTWGFDVPVIVRSAAELRRIIASNPFDDDRADITQLHLTLLKEKPAPAHLDQTSAIRHDPDQFTIKGKEIFILCKGKYHQTKLTNAFFEKKLNTPTTTRNWKTILKLKELTQ